MKAKHAVLPLAKIALVIFLALFLLCSVFYVALVLYVNSKAIKITETELREKCSVELTQEQQIIAAKILSKTPKTKFARMPFIVDIFSKRNQIALLVAEIVAGENENAKKMDIMDSRIVWLGTKRHIEKAIPFSVCVDYIYSTAYFGEGIYGAKEAAQHYYSKPLQELTEEEFAKISLLLVNPAFYKIGSELSESRAQDFLQ